MRYAVINKTSNIVENIIELDSADQWGWHESHDPYIVVQSDTADIEDTYANGEFIPHPPKPIVL